MMSEAPNAAPATLPAERRGRAFGAWMLRIALGAAAGVAISLSLAWLVLQWAILPRIDQWRPELEARATQALGVQVRIGSIAVTDAGAAWHWARAIELRDVLLLRPPEPGAAAAAPAAGLRLPQVSATLSPASLLPGWDGRWRLRFDQLLIVGAQLDVRRERDGRILIAGLEPQAGASDDGAGADWFFSQHEFAIRGGSLVWTDLQRGLEPLALNAVDLVVRNGVRRHALRLDATPPAAWGGRFSLRGEFVQPVFGVWAGGASGANETRADTHADTEANTEANTEAATQVDTQPDTRPEAAASAGAEPAKLRSATLLARPGDWTRWRGQFYVEFADVDVQPLRAHLRTPIDLLRGHGALRAWIDIRAAKPTAATLDLALRDVAVQLDAGGEPLSFVRIDGRLGARLDGPRAERPPAGASAPDPTGPDAGLAARLWGGPLRAEFRAQGFGFETADGLVWPRADVDLDARFDGEGRLDGGALKAPRLDLGLLARLFERVPSRWVGAAAHEGIAALAAQGVAEAVDARWQGPITEPSSYAVKARLRGLTLAAAPAPMVPARTDEARGAAPRPPEGASAPGRIAELHAAPGRPGVRNLDLDLDASEAGGTARVALHAGELELPGVFEAARLPLDALDARLDWRRSPGRDGARAGIDLRARELRFANADAEGEFELRWQRSAGTSPLGLLDLKGRLARADATAVSRYLPLRLPVELRRYLERAIQAGTARAVDVRVRGDLRDFPFGTPVARTTLDLLPAPTEFRVSAQLDGVRFAYQPGDPAWDPADPGSRRPWPAFTDIKGELVFDRQSLELRRLQGRLGTVGSGSFEVNGLRGGIRDLLHQSTLSLEGSGRGTLADALAFIHATPVERWLGQALAQAQVPLAAGASAPVELKLALELPLKQIAQSTVRGSVVLAGNDLKLRPELPVLGNARARIGFTEHGFELEGGARLLGGDATIEGGSQADGSVRLAINGTASAEGLRRFAEGEPQNARLLAALSGQAGYRLALGFARGQTEWQLASNLVGLGLDLPAPLRKSPEAAWPLQVRSSAVASSVVTPVADGPAAAREAVRDLLRIDLGPESARILQAAWLRESGPQGSRVLRGAVAVGEELPALADGPVSARITLDRLDLDAWQALAAASGAGAGGTAGAGSRAGVGGYLPATLVLRTPLLVAGGREWHRAQASVTRGAGNDDGLWRAQVEATEVEGTLEYRAPGSRGAGQDGRLQARLARLVLPRQESDAVGRLLDSASPTRVPALDIAVDELELNGKRLGRVEIEAVNRAADPAAGEPAVWQLDKFRMGLPGAQLTATGRWAAARPAGAAPGPAARRALMDFRLDVSDGGAFLARLGQPDVVKGAKGHLSGQLQWSGSPLAIDYPSLAGQVRAEFESGQFLRADPGAARLLGVLSLQSLPRRLLFDFRDVFEQGFAFDSVQGDVEIAQGVATSRNLRMKGVQAAVLMEGRADLARETQDLHVWVVPEINAGTASLAVAAINPALGIGSFLAQLFLRRPLIEAGTREFTITGPWAEPKVERIERTRAAPDGDAVSPAPPRSTPAPQPTPESR